ncbi:MAG: 2-C-methyl-D-erythritol 2,4-cyclodiphosphate synthase [Alloprevotella sp.]
MNIRVGMGFDVHQLQPGLPLWLGGVQIPHTHGLLGHSDADVLIHALCDALLGAASLRDIGWHFPDTAAEYAGIRSTRLLEATMQLLAGRGWHLANADVTVMAQQPKLSPYIESMRATLAPILKVDLDAVSIKATTTEKLGFTGRGEGIAAQAVVLISRD